MTAETFDPRQARFIITSAGLIALECDGMGVRDEARLFGPDGQLPPQSLTALIDDMLETVLCAPGLADRDRLRLLAHDLKASCAKLETGLAQLDND